VTDYKILTASVKRLPRGYWWAYVPFAFVSAFFAVWGWGDGGFSAAWPYILLLGICLVQWIRPTCIVWILMFASSVFYAVAVAVTLRNGPFGDYVFFFACGAIPAVALICARPWKKFSPPSTQPHFSVQLRYATEICLQCSVYGRT
jgi:hypothetical protein